MINNKLKDNILAVICARGNSKGLKNKNLISLNGKPLIYYAINKVVKNNLTYRCLSTDNENIIDISKKYGLKSFFKRSKKLSTASVSKLDVWKNALDNSEKYYNKKFKFILDVEVTNPLTTPIDLANFLKRFNKIKNRFDGMFCVRESWKNPYFNILIKKKNKFKVVKDLKKKIFSRQLAPKTYDHIAALYIFKSSYIRKTKYLLDGNLAPYKLHLLKSIDIDNREDFDLVKIIHKNRYVKL
tara:strand:+ start:1738 stop:2463 length:726 start_codon:yes stop_codon:yes gene_type:complete